MRVAAKGLRGRELAMRGDAPGVGAAHRHARPDEGCTRVPARARARNALRLLALGPQTCAVGTFALALAPTREPAMQTHDGVERAEPPLPVVGPDGRQTQEG